ncbi:mitochondrial aldehyde dehydrogenase [Aspergillus melleus]|uniref:mitochondrial aldehyde dehydrogenase n=1 Tax=Aspergillus melleus TaxID=138277 RepID=UPI001E8CFA74|nr:mitochondrial aldehyde dehydrogenase [Aspergillus melleus]KAH8429020.1 mitochondrial aldehyde dehydrogenase [Aspergillus melleus]
MSLSVDLTAPNGRQYTQPTGLFIDNEFVKSVSGAEITSINPSDDTIITKVYAAGTDDVDLAVRAARRALKDPTWRDLSPTDRGELLNKLADLIDKHREVLATIETWDNGKPYLSALNGDIDEVVLTFRYYAGWADKMFGQTISTTHAKFAYTLRQPIGVVGQIIPWNYPLGMASWKLAPALACGNTVVLKAAEQTPLSILYFANLIKSAGFPPGVVNLLNGRGSECGAALVQHPDVDKIASTGSTATGREIMRQAALTMKNVTLETGGKSPLLVFDDADIEQAAKWAHRGVMSNQGQICCATSLVLVHERIAPEFLKLLKDEVANISKVVDPFAESTFQGPQVSKEQHELVLSYVMSGEAEGATLAAGGRPYDVNGKGFFIAPTIFTDVTPSMRIYREEIFGPCVVILPFRTEAEAIEMANDSMYGLGAGIFTRDIGRAHRLAEELESGMVWINSGPSSDPRIPFGGVKQSGIGRELGEAGLEAYSQIKAVHVNMGTRL